MNALPNPMLASSPADPTVSEPTAAQLPSPSPRLPFVPPVLTKQGKVAALTQFYGTGDSGIEPPPE